MNKVNKPNEITSPAKPEKTITPEVVKQLILLVALAASAACSDTNEPVYGLSGDACVGDAEAHEPQEPAICKALKEDEPELCAEAGEHYGLNLFIKSDQSLAKTDPKGFPVGTESTWSYGCLPDGSEVIIKGANVKDLVICVKLAAKAASASISCDMGGVIKSTSVNSGKRSSFLEFAATKGKTVKCIAKN